MSYSGSYSTSYSHTSGAGNSQGTSAGQSNAQSNSVTNLLQSPQSAYSLALSQEAAGIGKDQYDWAVKAYNGLQPTSNAAIGNYLNTGAMANELGQSQQQQYQQMYQPAQAAFNQYAGTYASAPRIAQNMGAAEAGATQAGAAGWENTKRSLQAAGVDPSSGEYAGLKAAADTAAGASAAGAANQARQATQQQGAALQEQNINFGMTEPASALNAYNTNFGAQQGAVNTGESTVNTGVNATSSANNFYGTAGSALKLPSTGVNSESTSGSSQTSNTSSANANVSDSGSQSSSSSSGGYAGGGVVAPKMSAPKLHAPDMSKPHATKAALPKGAGAHAKTPHHPRHHASGIPMPQQQGPPPGASDDDAASDLGPGAPGAKGQTPQGAAPMATPDQSQPAPPQAPPTPVGTEVTAAADNESDEGFAKGGGIPDPYHVHGLPDAVSGGHVPYGISPSHGHTTDDVVANLNAGEFVIPRDVTHHYGNKFFYDLINKGRKESHKMSGETRGMPNADKSSSPSKGSGAI